MTFCLNTTIVKPQEGEEIKSAVILLHGYGGDGKDISMLTLNWKRFLKNTIFLLDIGQQSRQLIISIVHRSKKII